MTQNPLSLAIGRLSDESGEHRLGTAFAVSSSRALTAFHCIGDYKTGSVKHRRVLLEFPVGRRVAADYVAGDQGADYAILSLRSALPAGLMPVSLLARAFPHEPFRCAGYPSFLQGPDITSVGGRVTAVESSIFGGVPAIQLFSDEGAAGLSLQGFSGAPVLVRNPEGAIGIIRWNPPQTTAPHLALGGIVFSCPVRLIVDKHPEFAASVVPVRYEGKIAELLSVLATLDDADRDQLSQALKELHREKVAKAEVRAIRPEWTAIPYWSFQLPIGDQPEETRKGFVKAVIRTIARSLEEQVPRTVAEVQILILLKLIVDGDTLKVTLACPSQEVVAYLFDHTPPRATSAQWVEDLNRLSSDLTHQYAIVPGALTPIVFQYKPVLRRILATNRNQADAPKQFYNPHLCKTTSNFLNFIGTLHLQTLLKFSDGTTPIYWFDNFEKLFSAGLDQWFAWFYHYLDTGVFFDLDRLFIGTTDPEQYRYHYVPARESETGSRANDA